MSRKRWLVLGVDQDESAALPAGDGSALWRVRLRAPEKTEPTYVVYVSQVLDKAAPYVVGGTAELDERLLSVEGESPSE